MSDNLQAMAGSDGVSVHSGFPNPALEHRGPDTRLSLDLNQLLIRHPFSTYLFRVAGHSQADQGIFDGDVVLVDRALPIKPTSRIVAWQNGSFTICRPGQLEPGLEPWGVVMSVIHSYQS